MRTDHMGLRCILSMDDLDGKRARRRLRLQEFNFEETCWPGIVTNAMDELTLFNSLANASTHRNVNVPTMTILTTPGHSQINVRDDDEDLLPSGEVIAGIVG